MLSRGQGTVSHREPRGSAGHSLRFPGVQYAGRARIDTHSDALSAHVPLLGPPGVPGPGWRLLKPTSGFRRSGAGCGQVPGSSRAMQQALLLSRYHTSMSPFNPLWGLGVPPGPGFTLPASTSPGLTCCANPGGRLTASPALFKACTHPKPLRGAAPHPVQKKQTTPARVPKAPRPGLSLLISA